jgi:hypothetical protein
MSNTEFIIEKDIPTPKGYNTTKYPWEKMEIGDSFFVPTKAKKHNKLGQLHWSFKGYCKVRGLNWKITCRTELDGIRVWRLK